MAIIPVGGIHPVVSIEKPIPLGVYFDGLSIWSATTGKTSYNINITALNQTGEALELLVQLDTIPHRVLMKGTPNPYSVTVSLGIGELSGVITFPDVPEGEWGLSIAVNGGTGAGGELLEDIFKYDVG